MLIKLAEILVQKNLHINSTISLIQQYNVPNIFLNIKYFRDKFQIGT